MSSKEHNPFKQIEEAFDPPEELKTEIMESIDHLQLISDIADLFSGKLGQTLTSMFKTNIADDSHPREDDVEPPAPR